MWYFDTNIKNQEFLLLNKTIGEKNMTYALKNILKFLINESADKIFLKNAYIFNQLIVFN